MTLHSPSLPTTWLWATALALFAAGCSGSETETTPTTSAPVDMCANAGDERNGEPPEPPESAAAPDASADLVLAVSNFYLGLTTLDGKTSATAWEQYGFNLDRTVSGKSACVCQPVLGVRESALSDAPLGVDNAYGKDLIQIISSVDVDFEKKTRESIAAGEHTWLFHLAGVGKENAYSGLSATAYEAAGMVGPDGQPAAPKLDGTDVWPIGAQSFREGVTDSPQLVFNDAYTTVGDDGKTVWVGHGKGSIHLRIAFEGDDFRVRIVDPWLVLPLSADRTRVEHGMLGGTLVTEEVAAEVARVMGFFEWDGEQLCMPHDTVASVLQQIRQASDMLEGGALDANADCDRISIGIGLDAVTAHLGEVVPAEVLVDPCAK